MTVLAPPAEGPPNNRRPSATGRTSPAPARRSRSVPAAPSLPGRLARAEPSAARVSQVVARALLEVLRGYRPPSQLARWTCPHLQYDLERRAPRRPSGPRMHLTRIRIAEPGDGVAEVCAMAFDPGCGRVRVYAFRLELRPGAGWTVTRLQAG